MTVASTDCPADSPLLHGEGIVSLRPVSILVDKSPDDSIGPGRHGWEAHFEPRSIISSGQPLVPLVYPRAVGRLDAKATPGRMQLPIEPDAHPSGGDRNRGAHSRFGAGGKV